LGQEKFYQILVEDWLKFVEQAHKHNWCEMVYLNGPQQISALYDDMIKGNASPSKGYICNLNQTMAKL
jgi:hypothetical protein